MKVRADYFWGGALQAEVAATAEVLGLEWV